MRPLRRWGLGARLLAAIIAVVLVAASTALAVAVVIGPVLFHDHLLLAGGEDNVVEHAERAFDDASAISLSLALLAGLATSVVVSVFLTRRITRSLRSVRQAAGRVADGDYAVRVPEVGMGEEFDDLARAFNTMATDLGRIEQTRTQLLGDLAHEMRTPVATLDAYLEAIQDGFEQADTDTLLMMREQVGRLARLAEDISLVTTAEEGRLSMRREPVDVGRLVSAAVTQASGRYGAEGVDLAVRAPDDARRTVLMADADRLGQLLTNLLDNALRHTPAGGRVEVAAERVGDVVRLRVADTGSGIAAEHLSHVFERFYRADSARDRAHGGSGVGLAIVRSIARAHGGRVTVGSDGVGRGAVFTVELPVLDRAPAPHRRD
ncbi:HAMP domain-containing protein [Georgenia sp. EYE_87]|uniref:sensor histidine kinase n=1 Tax=Georgenia sp. EYE_87 TaxID=2853448 RepID=UPI002003C244|nr:ATP-binding protein [Georgenia sp. EYE_87]MCK6210309.1 HAMP domain-containing protein [Georgenia sp. EYE_87]